MQDRPVLRSDCGNGRDASGTGARASGHNNHFGATGPRYGGRESAGSRCLESTYQFARDSVIPYDGATLFFPTHSSWLLPSYIFVTALCISQHYASTTLPYVRTSLPTDRYRLLAHTAHLCFGY